MTIKAKLAIKVILVVVMIGAVAISSFLGMTVIRQKLTYLTEKSTPFQLRTVEFQWAIQATTSDFIRIAAARTRQEFTVAKNDADHSLQIIRESQRLLEGMSGDRFSVLDDLEKVYAELVSVSDSRLVAEAEAVRRQSLSINA